MSTLTLAAPVVNPTPPANPRDSWPTCTDADAWELGPGPDGGPDPVETGPTAGPDFTPTAESEAYWAGFTLGLAGEFPEPPADFAGLRRADFIIGRVDGLMALIRREREEQLEIDRRAAERRDEAFTLPGEGWPDSERIEAVGCIEARRANA